MAGAWLAACAATVVAAVIWGLIAPFIGLPGAVMAWGVAGIFGVIAGLIARTSSITFCLAACGGALLCLLVGKLISAGVVMASIGLIDTAASFGNMFIPETGVTMGALEDLVSEGTLTQEQQALAEKRTRAFFQNQGSADLFGINGETDSNVYLELNNKIRERVGSMSAAEKTVILERSRDRYPGWIEEPGMRIAIINHLVVKGLIEDQDLLRHADATMLTAMGEYPEDYYSRLPANKQEKLDPELGALVSETFRSMDAQQLEEAIRNCMKDNPQWTPRRHEFLAALDRMQNEETIPEHLVETATNTILAEMDNDYSVYPGYDEQMSEAEYELEFEKQNKLDKELRILVNKERNKLGQDDLDALVKQAKAGHPNWKTETEMTDIFDLFDDGLNEAKASFGSDGTFGSSLASRFKFMDTIWFALGLASCFAIVFTLGKAAE